MFTKNHQTITDGNFSNQKLRGYSFRGRNLTGANFSHADIRGADFRKANLVNTNFSYAQAGVQSHWTMLSIAFALRSSQILSRLQPQRCKFRIRKLE
jgi:uncharacterized protein YjbI with pentapeptide repeats